MDYKTIGIAAGFFGLGSLFTWALTADIYSARVVQLEESASDLSYLLSVSEQEAQELATYMAPRIETPVPETLTSSEQIEAMKPVGWDDEPIEIIEDESEGEEAVIESPEEKAYVERLEHAVAEEVEYQERTSEVRDNLQKLIDQYSTDEGQKEDFVDQAVKTFSRDHRPPFVIDRDEYAWSTGEAEDYSKITLTYYPNHRLLLDDQDEVVENVAETVGWRSLSSFGKESGSHDTVFVRCPRLLTDFEVIREDEEEPPLHVRYGMDKTEFEAHRAAGNIKFRPEDQ